MALSSLKRQNCLKGSYRPTLKLLNFVMEFGAAEEQDPPTLEPLIQHAQHTLR